MEYTICNWIYGIQHGLFESGDVSMDMAFEIRQATADDGEELLDLWHGFTDHLSSYDTRYEHKESANDRWLAYFENQLIDSKYGTVFVAEHDENDQLIGVLEARIMGNHPIFRLENHGYINGHYVDEDYRNQGVGQALLDAVDEWFTSPPHEVDFYRVDVVDGDARAADFYEEAEFSSAEHVYEKRVE